MRIGWAALVLTPVLTGWSAAQAGCVQEVGPRRAGELARQCRDVSPATRPPCNAVNACALMESEIRRGCALLGADAPPFCETVGAAPDAADEDDEDDDAEPG